MLYSFCLSKQFCRHSYYPPSCSIVCKHYSEKKLRVKRSCKVERRDFADKAPAPVIAKEREKLAAYKETAEKIKAQLK